MDISLKNYALYSFAVDGASPVPQSPVTAAAIEEYVRKLVEFLDDPKTNVRGFKFAEGRKPEAKSLLCSFPEKKDFDGAADALSTRLNETQIAAEKGNIEITHGDLLSVYYSSAGCSYALLAKLEQMEFLNRSTLQKDQGFPFVKNRLLKTCLCQLVQEVNGWEVGDVSLYDSNSSIAKFWWHDFLELVELTNDETNSQRSYAAWKEFIDKNVRPKSKGDALILKNAIGGVFKNKQPYDHSAVVNSILTNYCPENPNLDMKLISQKAQNLPQQSKALGKRFDSNFQIAPSATNIRLKPIHLTAEIDLILKTHVVNLKGVVMPLTHQNKRGVFVASEAGFAEISST